MPEQNQTVTLSDSVIGEGYSLFEALIVHTAQVSQPWLSLPIVSSIFEWVVYLLLGRIETTTKKAVAFAIIDAQTDAEYNDLKKAKAAFIAAESVGDNDALSQASKDMDAAFDKLITS